MVPPPHGPPIADHPQFAQGCLPTFGRPRHGEDRRSNADSPSGGGDTPSSPVGHPRPCIALMHAIPRPSDLAPRRPVRLFRCRPCWRPGHRLAGSAAQDTGRGLVGGGEAPPATAGSPHPRCAWYRGACSATNRCRPRHWAPIRRCPVRRTGVGPQRVVTGLITRHAGISAPPRGGPGSTLTRGLADIGPADYRHHRAPLGLAITRIV